MTAVEQDAAPAVSKSDLVGSWRLVSFTQYIVDDDETIDVFGAHPVGYIHYDASGRMLVLMVSEQRPLAGSVSVLTEADRAELFRTMVAYAGSYTVENNTIRHHIDASWNQIFTGGDQIRKVDVSSDRFVMSTEAVPRSQDGRTAISRLTWERCRPGP